MAAVPVYVDTRTAIVCCGIRLRILLADGDIASHLMEAATDAGRTSVLGCFLVYG